MKAPFSWDHFSDQPYQLKDRGFKRAMRKKALFSIFLTFLSALFILPLAYIFSYFVSKRHISTEHFFGMSINLDKAPHETQKLIDELGVKQLLIRFPLWEMEKLPQYIAFIKHYSDKKILLNIMQDREHIEDLQLLKTDLQKLFSTTAPFVDYYQVGTTINRAKWGFFSVHEYLRFFQIAYMLKRQKFTDIKLIGPSVIDFEYHFTAHALFNFFKLKYDAVSSLLYVDRRGAPENRQMGFDLLKKIDLLDALALLSPKTARRCYITETNWPISNTAPYAPTSEHECVSEETYANFMVRYYLLAFASQKIDAVYWHQLIAPGLGLVDNREGIRKRSAFAAFKTMITILEKMQFVSLEQKDGFFTLSAENRSQTVRVYWAVTPKILYYDTRQRYIDRDGSAHEETRIEVGPAPLYLITERSNETN